MIDRLETHIHYYIQFPNESSYVVWVDADQKEAFVHGLPFQNESHTEDRFFMDTYGALLPLNKPLMHTKELAYYRINGAYVGYNTLIDTPQQSYKTLFANTFATFTTFTNHPLSCEVMLVVSPNDALNQTFPTMAGAMCM